jgi:GABA permease
MWLFPYLTIATVVGIVVILVLMAFDPGQQSSILLSAISAAVIVGAGVAIHRRRSREQSQARTG